MDLGRRSILIPSKNHRYQELPRAHVLHNCQITSFHAPNDESRTDHSTGIMKLISSILSLDESWKLRIHITQISLIVLAIILSIGRVTIRNPPATRANTVAITMVRIFPRPIHDPHIHREHMLT